MTDLIAVPVKGSGMIVVESDQAVGGVVKARRPGEIVVQAEQGLEVALDSVTAAAKSVMAKLREAGPDEITVEFGLKLTAEVGAVVTKTAGECNFKVTLCWERAGDVAS